MHARLLQALALERARLSREKRASQALALPPTHPATHSTAQPPTWLISCMCPVMRASGCFCVDGSQRKSVKSSEPARAE